LKGIYVLIIQLEASVQIRVGALGNIAFPAGTYAYVGSAQNNLEQRVKRHLQEEKKLFWHIDYLLADKAANVVQVYYAGGDKTCECSIAHLLAEKAVPILGFGCSDCNCGSHLFHAENFQFIADHMRQLKF
jgi:Uri superfamily endonuclease